MRPIELLALLEQIRRDPVLSEMLKNILIDRAPEVQTYSKDVKKYAAMGFEVQPTYNAVNNVCIPEYMLSGYYHGNA